MLALYDYFRSSACFRVRIALNLKKLDYKVIPIHLVNNNGEQFSAEYTRVNPQNLVPSLQDEDHVITQSIAIIEYLDEKYPSHSLLPKDVYQKALVRSFALSIAADIHPLNNLRVLTYLTKVIGISNEQKTLWYQHWIALGLSALEKKLVSYNTTSDFCFGQQPTLADICLIPQIYNAKRFECDLTEYPTLTRIYNQCLTLEAFKQAWPIEATA